MLYEFKGHRPSVDPTSFVHPQAAVTGNVTIGKNVYIGPGAAIRGDWGGIVIEDGCNVQENCTIHMFPGVLVVLKEGAHIGHGAIVHGAVIGRNCLIGMNSVIMDNVEIEDECIVGALSFIKAGEKIPRRSLIAGNPAKILKEVSDEMLRWKTEGTALYQALPAEMRRSWQVSEGEHEIAAPEQSPLQTEQQPGYRPWKETGGYPTREEPIERKVEEPAARYRYGKRMLTIEDYLQIEAGANQKHEYYKGEVFAMAGAKMDHNIIVVNLTGSLVPKLRNSPCRPFNSEQRIFVENNELFTYPDLSIVCGPPITRDNDGFNLMNPSVIVEVLSPSTKAYDQGDKFTLYQELPTFREYLLIDSQSVLVEQFIKKEEGEWILRRFTTLADTFLLETTKTPISLEEIYEGTGFPKMIL